MAVSGFTKVIVIGYGIVTGDVLRWAYENAARYGYSIEYIEYEVHPFNVAKKYAHANKLVYRMIENKKELFDYFMAIKDEKVLIISASNNFLFPKEMVEKEYITIINFHNALLPNFPGRNAPSWAIYEKEKVTGITWHYVTDKIDEGNIIIQKECEIPWNIRAYELVAMLMHLASDAFRECFEDVLLDNVKTRCQNITTDRKMYKASEIPGNGRFELTDPPQEIYRLLRALDYGKNKIFPLPITEYNGKIIKIKRYKIVLNENRRESENIISIIYDEDNLLQMKYDVVCAIEEM